MKKFLAWLKGLFFNTPEGEFNNGYQWANEELRKGRTTTEELGSFVYGSSDPFDKGVLQAIRERIKTTYEEYQDVKS